MPVPIKYDIIFNDEFDTQLATLFTKGGHVIGHKKFEGHESSKYSNQKWHVIPKGGVYFAFQNEATKSYAGPDFAAHRVVGSTEEYAWRLVSKNTPLPGYYFETKDGELTWFLPSGTDGTQIELKPLDNIHEKDEAKAEWVYRPV